MNAKLQLIKQTASAIKTLRENVAICAIDATSCQLDKKQDFLEIAEGLPVRTTISPGFIHHTVEVDGMSITYLS